MNLQKEGVKKGGNKKEKKKKKEKKGKLDTFDKSFAIQ
jgi:hypothetical protein